MGRIIVVQFVSLDGVIQAPGAPDEDSSGGFRFGGWVAPFTDEKLDEALKFTYEQPYNLLLGRKTYDIFAAYWPRVKSEDEMTRKFQNEFNACTKFVATHHPETLKWENSVSLGNDIAEAVRALKVTTDKNLLVLGSSELTHKLFAEDLVDELHLFTAPVILGKGKRLFDETSKPVAMMLNRWSISKTDMIFTVFVREGEVQTGTVGPE